MCSFRGPSNGLIDGADDGIPDAFKFWMESLFNAVRFKDYSRSARLSVKKRCWVGLGLEDSFSVVMMVAAFLQ